MPVNQTASDYELVAARRASLRMLRMQASGAFTVMVVFVFFAAWVASTLGGSAFVQHLITAAALALVCGPMVAVAVSAVVRQVSVSETVADARQERLDAEGQHRELESKVADALEMAENENEALRVIERGFAIVLPHQPVELLLADNSHAHLSRRAFTAPEGAMADCQVASPQECPAARRARVHHFPDSDAVNACPKLADREQGRCSALCIPVSVMGRTVGVIHSVQPVGAAVDDACVKDLQSIANQAGARLGMLRIMAETQLQASTDALTGLLNRRAFENGFLALRGTSRTGPAVVAMADLDNFKLINDTYGHATGDRALRVFAETLRSVLRDKDLLCRRGGEEFAIVFPDCDLPSAALALDRVRAELQTALIIAGVPTYTASFGAIPAHLDDDLDTLLTRADTALFEAKRNGRDRVVIHDNPSTEQGATSDSTTQITSTASADQRSDTHDANEPPTVTTNGKIVTQHR